MEPSRLAALALLLAAAIWAHYAFWTWRLRAQPREDELLFGETRDGWRVALGRRRPKGPAARPVPVLLVHGIAANRLCLDFGVERWSLAAHLARAGFDCFALDLRGHGRSRPARRGAPRGWSFDDYLRQDIPAALDAIRAATGQDRVLWVGHSQGGLLGLAACAAYPERVAGLVALGAPVYWDVQDRLKLFARFGFLLAGRWNRFLARMLAPLSGYLHLPVSEIAINGRNVSRPVYRRVLANVVENISPGVVAQFARWISTDTFAAADGALDYRAALGRCRQPALFVAAEADRIAPPAVVVRAAAAWGGPSAVVRFGCAGGSSVQYGHTDLLLGVHAPEEVFPRIAAWLAEQAP
ncbi:alpha/beta hydrolase [Anaeromyxobacter diazotrophicus]|uniref:alpha/beta hydrolase n=1 Tax=Anaeromyxobacter diazotrophicus TaxID=2590199 RepID=UPI001F4327DB|nr:alpha/beta hydrolase [Anaeromyxobacter diazotrophicus]